MDMHMHVHKQYYQRQEELLHQIFIVPHFLIMANPPTLQRIPASEGREVILKALQEDGAVIIKGLFTRDQVERLNAEVQPAMDKLNVGSKHTEEWVKEFHGDNTKRLNNAVSLSKTFRHEILESELIHEICEEIYLKDAGGYWMNSAQIIDIGASNTLSLEWYVVLSNNEYSRVASLSPCIGINGSSQSSHIADQTHHRPRK
jgi:hypothetical protein